MRCIKGPTETGKEFAFRRLTTVTTARENARRCACLCKEVCLSVQGGVLVCARRCACLCKEVWLSVQGGVIICARRCDCLCKEVCLSVQGGVIVCARRCACLCKEVWLSVQGGVIVCARRCACLTCRQCFKLCTDGAPPCLKHSKAFVSKGRKLTRRWSIWIVSSIRTLLRSIGCWQKWILRCKTSLKLWVWRTPVRYTTHVLCLHSSASLWGQVAVIALCRYATRSEPSVWDKNVQVYIETSVTSDVCAISKVVVCGWTNRKLKLWDRKIACSST
jgi:hypothetical protein